MPLSGIQIRDLKPKEKPYRVSDFGGLSVTVTPRAFAPVAHEMADRWGWVSDSSGGVSYRNSRGQQERHVDSGQRRNTWFPVWRVFAGASVFVGNRFLFS